MLFSITTMAVLVFPIVVPDDCQVQVDVKLIETLWKYVLNIACHLINIHFPLLYY